MAARRADDGTLLASAQRLTRSRINPGTQVGRGRSASPAGDTGWQADAWDMYSLVGELQFLVNTIANRAGQARFYVGHLSDDTTEDPEQVTDQRIADVLVALADSPKQLRQYVTRLAAGLLVAGEGWLVGIPSALVPPSLLTSTSLDPTTIDEPRGTVGMIDGGTNLDDIEWRALSTSELSFPEEGKVALVLGGAPGESITVDVDAILLIRVWRPHPKIWHEPDSPVRSLLSPLRTLVGLDMRTAAQVDSRLAGAGLLIVPASAQRSLQAAAALAAEVDPTTIAPDQFTEALMTAMVTAVRDRSSASSFVPIVATVPDEATGLFNFLDFSKDLDQYAPDLVDQAIRRIAMGMDVPPELLTGSSAQNHWGAWLTSIETVHQHIAPLVELICDALTTQYLWPVLVSALGMSQDEARQHVVWYEVEHLVVRPNRAGEAMELFDRGIISAQAVRRESGYEEGDAPDSPPPVQPTSSTSPTTTPPAGDAGGPPTQPGPPQPTTEPTKGVSQ